MGYKNEKVNDSIQDQDALLSLERFARELPQKITKDQMDETRSERIEREWTGFQKQLKKQSSFGKKAAIYAIASAASILLFVGSGFVSPTMAKMVSKIPPLSSLYEKYDDEQLHETITKALKKEGYPVEQVLEHGGGKEEGMYVFLDDTKENVKKMDTGVKKIAYGILKKRTGTKYEDYYVRVRMKVEPSKKIEAENARLEKETEEVFNIINPVLSSFNFQNSYGFGPEGVELDFSNLEKKERVAEIKLAVENALKTAGKDSAKVKIRIFDQVRQDQYNRWGPAISAIAEELKTYKKYQVSSVGYQSRNGVLRVLIRIKLPASDPKAAELATDLNTMIEEFIKTDEIQQMVKDDPYEIVIDSKDKKKLN
ncbi:hypothetical protein CVD28_12435 [Bacillus sp. M6-12]|uniref:DUF4179 domain-containing protein n=1 Tax=Bacillus sp. M6-12 TaxID=2054166 RepID=UPI000C773C0E|nr:DUF4030 domain-containing protein [Bacillus sp. M6-12]PLS17367.1 hypothetical protein CVD28_12435 [Bacillus sp. M6-12]